MGSVWFVGIGWSPSAGLRLGVADAGGSGGGRGSLLLDVSEVRVSFDALYVASACRSRCVSSRLSFSASLRFPSASMFLSVVALAFAAI